MASYAVLGDHGSVARVRLFLDDGNVVDENFPMPTVITVEDQLAELAKKRIEEIAGGMQASSDADAAHIGHVDELPQLKDALETVATNV